MGQRVPVIVIDGIAMIGLILRLRYVFLDVITASAPTTDQCFFRDCPFPSSIAPLYDAVRQIEGGT